MEGVDPENHIKLTTYSSDNRMQNTAASKTHVHKITNVHFFEVEVMILMGANLLIRRRNGFDPIKTITSHAT